MTSRSARSTTRRLRAYHILFIAASALPTTASASSYSWSSAASGAWTDPARWSPTGTRDSAGDAAHIGAHYTPENPYTVALTTSATIHDFSLDGRHATLRLEPAAGERLVFDPRTAYVGFASNLSIIGNVEIHGPLRNDGRMDVAPSSTVSTVSVRDPNGTDPFVPSFHFTLGDTGHLHLDAPLRLVHVGFFHVGGSFRGDAPVLHALLRAWPHQAGTRPPARNGPALASGGTYTLVIDETWPDATNRPLPASFKKTLRVGPPDVQQPDPARWSITSPQAATMRAVSIAFEEAFDHAMLHRVLTVRDAAGHRIAGQVTVADHERRWSFTPEAPWQPGPYVIAVETILEDAAGNSIARPFEVNLNKSSIPAAPEIVELPFEVSQ